MRVLRNRSSGNREGFVNSRSRFAVMGEEGKRGLD